MNLTHNAGLIKLRIDLARAARNRQAGAEAAAAAAADICFSGPSQVSQHEGRGSSVQAAEAEAGQQRLCAPNLRSSSQPAEIRSWRNV